MGRLIFKNKLEYEIDPSWYFSDTWYNCTEKKWIYKWPSKEFPYEVSIFSKELEKNQNKVDIRKYIENNLHGNVILAESNLSYIEYYDKNWEVATDDNAYYEHFREITNIWNIFYFEDEQDAIMFRIRFSDIIRPISKFKPDGY